MPPSHANVTQAGVSALPALSSALDRACLPLVSLKTGFCAPAARSEVPALGAFSPRSLGLLSKCRFEPFVGCCIRHIRLVLVHA
jgi:hypothetical protein